MLRRLTSLALVLYVLVGCTTPAPVPTPAPPAPSAAPLNDQQAREIGAALGSGDPSQIANVVAMPSGQEISRKTAIKLRNIGELTLDAASFAPLDETTASVRASTKDSRWLLYLVHVGGVWKISETEQL